MNDKQELAEYVSDRILSNTYDNKLITIRLRDDWENNLHGECHINIKGKCYNHIVKDDTGHILARIDETDNKITIVDVTRCHFDD